MAFKSVDGWSKGVDAICIREDVDKAFVGCACLGESCFIDHENVTLFVEEVAAAFFLGCGDGF